MLPSLTTGFDPLNIFDKELQNRFWRDDGETLTAEIDMPGVNREDIDARIEGNTLRVKAENERRSYYKSLSVPEQAAGIDNLKAHFENGVLTFSLPKTTTYQSDRGRRITVYSQSDSSAAP